MKINVLCYKTKVPVVYGSGGSCSVFLYGYAPANNDEAAAMVDWLNKDKPAEAWRMGGKIDWNEVDYFFLSEQEPFDTTGD